MTFPEKLGTARGLESRDAFVDWNHVGSDLLFGGATDALPLVSIVIPTFRRLDYLISSVRSALAQRIDLPFEIIVVDNNPAKPSLDGLLLAIPSLGQHNVRYFVNQQNLGLFGNFNRGVELARGEWVSILQDDDLLDENWLSEMFEAIARNPNIDGLVCRQRFQFERSSVKVRSSTLRAIAKRLLMEVCFLGRTTRRIGPDKFFWGGLIGNGVGLVVRKKVVVALGGYDQQEFPPADHWYHTRFARSYRLHQHRAVLSTLRVQDNNATGKVENVKATMVLFDKFHRTMVQTEVPRWWLHFSPLLIVRDKHDFSEGWGVTVPSEEVERELMYRLPKRRPYYLWVMRLLLGGF